MAELRIYVASLSDYNAGILHGDWIDLEEKNKDDIWEEINEILKTSPTAKKEGGVAEEWAVHDTEGFENYNVGEYPDLDNLLKIVDGIEKHDGAFLAWVANSKSNVETRDFEEQFQGEWDSLGDYVQDYWDSCGELPKPPNDSWWHPLNYIDWEKMGEDLRLSGDIWTEDSPKGIWVFRSC